MALSRVSAANAHEKRPSYREATWHTIVFLWLFSLGCPFLLIAQAIARVSS
jgi:hypothetical protein